MGPLTNGALDIDYRTILNLVTEGSTVLDLGCGNGTLLKTLNDVRKTKGRGVEINEDRVIECLSKGLSVFQGNIEEGLAEYPDNSYDFVILNQTLQSVYRTEFLLNEMLRVGRWAVVGVPNFAHWRIRLSLGLSGTLPMTRIFHFEWYNTPNIRLVTVKDFKTMCARLGIRIVREFYTAKGQSLPLPFRCRPNLFAENALFLVEKLNRKEN